MALMGLTLLQCLSVAEKFIEERFYKNQSDSLASLLSSSSLEIWNDSGTADPAIMQVWKENLQKEDNITSLEALLAMKALLDYYFQASSSVNVKSLRQEVDEIISNGEQNKETWQKWQKHVNSVLQQYN